MEDGEDVVWKRFIKVWTRTFNWKSSGYVLMFLVLIEYQVYPLYVCAFDRMFVWGVLLWLEALAVCFF